jgi:nitrogen regulatory protein P-II 1
MKRIEAIFKPFKLEEIKDALREAGCLGMTVFDVKGFGRTGGKKEIYRGSAYVVDFVPKIMIVCIVEDHLAEEFVRIIETCAKTGRIGDGKIIVSDVVSLVRIRTGERDDDAIR